jgi:hypothetical protein
VRPAAVNARCRLALGGATRSTCLDVTAWVGRSARVLGGRRLGTSSLRRSLASPPFSARRALSSTLCCWRRRTAPVTLRRWWGCTARVSVRRWSWRTARVARIATTPLSCRRICGIITASTCACTTTAVIARSRSRGVTAARRSSTPTALALVGRGVVRRLLLHTLLHSVWFNKRNRIFWCTARTRIRHWMVVGV